MKTGNESLNLHHYLTRPLPLTNWWSSHLLTHPCSLEDEAGAPTLLPTMGRHATFYSLHALFPECATRQTLHLSRITTQRSPFKESTSPKCASNIQVHYPVQNVPQSQRCKILVGRVTRCLLRCFGCWRGKKGANIIVWVQQGSFISRSSPG